MYMPSIFRESLFDDFFEDFARPMKRVAGLNQRAAEVMRTDVKESDEGYELHIELPGYKKEDVKAELKDGRRHVFSNGLGMEEDCPPIFTHVIISMVRNYHLYE